MSGTAFQSSETIAAQPIGTFELRFVPAHEAAPEFPSPSAASAQGEVLSKPECVRGIRSALVIEAAVALLIYGVWQASHLLR